MRYLIGENDGLWWEDGGIRYCLHIGLSTEPESPIRDSIVRVAVWNSKYRMGNQDTDGISSGEYWRRLAGEATGREQPEGEDISFYRNQCMGLLAWQPIWAYQHSGITLSCGIQNMFSDRFDSGLAGYAVVLKRDMDGGPGWEEAAHCLIEDTITVYNDYLSGSVYCYSLMRKDKDGEWECIASEDNFYGYDLFENGMLGTLPDNLDSSLQKAFSDGTLKYGQVVSQTVTVYNYDIYGV